MTNCLESRKQVPVYRCNFCPVRDRGICGALEGTALEEFSKISRRRFIKDGDIIFHEGDEANYFYSVVFGAVKLSKNLIDGRQHIVELLYPPGFLGQRLESHHVYGAQAASDVELCCYPREHFERFVKRYVELERKVFELTVRELDLCRDRTLILARKNSLEQVASFLMMIVDRVPEIGCGQITENTALIRLPFTRAEIADYLGLTIETVSRQLSVLRKRRIIELRSWRDVVVPDIEQLKKVASIEINAKGPEKTAGLGGKRLAWGPLRMIS